MGRRMKRELEKCKVRQEVKNETDEKGDNELRDTWRDGTGMTERKIPQDMGRNEKRASKCVTQVERGGESPRNAHVRGWVKKQRGYTDNEEERREGGERPKSRHRR